METLYIHTSLYCSPFGGTKAVDDMRRELEAHGWTVIYADLKNPGASWVPFSGDLATQIPLDLALQRPGASQKDAQHDVETSITKTGNYSVAAGIAVTVAKIGGGIGDLAENPDKVFSAFEFAAAAVIAVAAVVLVVYAAPLIRTAAKAGGA